MNVFFDYAELNLASPSIVFPNSKERYVLFKTPSISLR
jgi:hypothetical protein